MVKVTIGPQTNTMGSPNPNPDPLSQPITEGPGAAFSEPSSSATNEPDHFDDLISDAGNQAATINISGLVDRETFSQNFIGAFNFGHVITGLQTLKIDGDKTGSAQECAGALYDIILETPMLHFMLNPSGKWVQRSLAIGMFAIPMAQGVKMELAARKRPVSAPSAKPAGPGMYTDARGVNVTGAGDMSIDRNAASALGA